MFLKELNKKEGNAFISLVKELATVDSDFSGEEELLIKDYMEELQLCEKCIEEMSSEVALNVLKGSNEKIRNIIYFEILGLALVDGSFDQKEMEFLSSIAKEMDIKEEKVTSFLEFFREVQFIYEVTYSNQEEKIKELEEMAKKLI